MTIKEFLELIKDYPSDTNIFFYNADDGYWQHIKNIKDVDDTDYYDELIKGIGLY